MKLQTSTGRKFWLTALVLPLFALATSCSSATDSTDPDSDDSNEPTTQGNTAEVFFVAENAGGTALVLFSEFVTIEQTDELAEEILGDLIEGELQPMDPDYSNLWDNSNELNDITISGDVATIDINLGKLNVGAEAEQRAIDQLVWTLTGIESNITTVRLLVNGKQVETLAGHVDATMDFTRAPDYEVLNAVQIHSPNEGQQFEASVTIMGQACTFEANVAWDLIKDGKMVQDGSTTAAMACPDRSDWSVDLGVLEPGTYVFNAREYSAEDGSLTSEDTKTFIVK